ncbi:MMPL family transporter [Halapricum sp. CBA1109]|uniref:MMPL family transporter n=1 Tax=Halapricum sp. CBA1109 TaxID=2668068 RepID=UPI0012F901E5|nr:MMPL family transporter [Halapricum sp. CBA1109]
MSMVDDIVGLVTGHTKIAIVVMVLLTAAVGAGAPMVEQESSLDQFQSDTDEADAQGYIDANFSTGPENTTRAQVIVRANDGGNVLSQDSLVAQLTFQQRLRDNETVNRTLAYNKSGPTTIGIANLLAQTSISQQTLREGTQRLNRYDFLDTTGTSGREALETAGRQVETQGRILENNTTRRATQQALRGAISTLLEDPNATVDAVFAETNANTDLVLNETDKRVINETATQAGTIRNETERRAVIGQGIRSILESKGEYIAAAGAELEQLQTDLQSQPSLSAQIEHLDSLEESELESLIESTIGGDGGVSSQAVRFMPVEGYDPGSTSANATTMLVTQQTDSPPGGTGVATDRIVDSQLAMQDLASQETNGQEFLLFGVGIITDETNRSMSDSLAIVGPLALLFVLIALALGYRDVLDIVLGLAGIVTVLIWTFGFMGWLGIDFNQIFISVPVLLIGLSIDYAIHIFMRHREERLTLGEGDDALAPSMRVALGGVGVALALVTATTVIGFMSNLVSPVPPIQDFGIVSSFGITAAFLVFGVLVPALKIEIDQFLENRGIDRKKRAIGTGGGRFGEILKIGSTGAKKAPYVVLVIALLVSAGGAYGASQVDTSFEQSDFLSDDPPDWMKDLPEPFAPGDYSAKENLEYVNERFQREDSSADLLYRGGVASPDGLERIKTGQAAAADKEVTLVRSDDEAAVQSPLTVINITREQNPDGVLNRTVTEHDTDGDGIPEENVTGVYDALFAQAPEQANQVLHRVEDGQGGYDYQAARITVTIKGTASSADTTDQMRSVASTASGGEVSVVATGQTIIFEIIQQQLLDTVFESLLITLVSVFAFLMIVYRITDGSATLGAVTLLPVLLSVSWILGTMYLLGIPFNILTGLITSLTIGLGVAYSIHLSERYNQELERTDSAWEAMDRSVTGTGGALLGSAATTVGGFGTLAVALLPPLQQFGVITGLTIIYAFLASVLVLPSLLVVWTRYVGPAEKLTDNTAPDGAADSTPTDD